MMFISSIAEIKELFVSHDITGVKSMVLFVLLILLIFRGRQSVDFT